MITFGTLASVLSQTSTAVKTAIGIAGLVAAISAAYVTGQAVMTVPSKLAKHDSVTVAGFRSLEKMLCIQVADHRKLDWQLCYINPAEVLPTDGSPR